MKKIFFAVLFFYVSSVKAQSLTDILNLAVKHSPQLAAAAYQQVAAQHAISIAEANYLPNIDIDALDAKGFPGSTSVLGVTGLMGSPYRSGASAGLVVTQTLWDFGRTNADVRVSKFEVSSARATRKITKDEVQQLALETYYACSLNRTQRDTWGAISHESSYIENEVNRFVNTGQRTVVDRYLSDSQTQEALTAQATYNVRYQNNLKELAVLTGVSASQLSCPGLRENKTVFSTQATWGNSPLLEKSRAEVNIAQAKLKRAQAEFFPKIVAMASVGNVEAARLVPRDNYAAGIGIVFPLFDGFKTPATVHQAHALVAAKYAEVAAAKQNLAEMNAKFDEDINSASIQISHLKTEVNIARQGFKIAKDRYYTFQGSLVDLREALRNLVRTESALNVAHAEWLVAVGDKNLLDGKQ